MPTAKADRRALPRRHTMGTSHPKNAHDHANPRTRADHAIHPKMSTHRMTKPKYATPKARKGSKQLKETEAAIHFK